MTSRTKNKFESFCQDLFLDFNHGKYDFIAPNVDPEYGCSECDIAAVTKSRQLHQVEIKYHLMGIRDDQKKFSSTYSDEKGDYSGGKIKKHEALEKGLHISNFFSFMAPVEILHRLPVDERYGLYGINRGGSGNPYIEVLREPKLLHVRRLTDAQMLNIAKKGLGNVWRRGVDGGFDYRDE